MTDLRYCQTCILPHTRPNLQFASDGSCNCATAAKKAAIDWSARAAEFRRLVADTRALGRAHDCVIPVSGGKDSTWQVVTAREHGLKPLAVTWKTPARTALGAANLQNLINLGVDHVDVSLNPRIERQFVLKAFERFGSPVIPMHMALHAIPLQFAVRFRIPVILWGENSAYEYGGADESLKGVRLTRAWLTQYGVTNGTSAEDWVDQDLSARELSAYVWPSDADQAEAGVAAVFLGHYFRWDPHETFAMAKRHGFVADDRPKTGFYAFADIDDEFLMTIHHWMKWYKFGFTRLWDNLSLEIRAGRISRNDAVALVRERGDEIPHEAIDRFCAYVGIPVARFFEIADRFRNREIWTKGPTGVWQLNSFLIDGWKWT